MVAYMMTCPDTCTCEVCQENRATTALHRALPEIIDWLEVETLVYRTEGRAGNADFAGRVVRLFKTYLAAHPTRGE